MDMIEEIRQVSTNAECLFDAASVEQAIDEVARRMTDDLSATVPVFMAIMNGGMVPLGKLITRLDFPLQVDFCHATRYRNQVSGSTMLWKVEPHCCLKDRTVVVVDDILDEGYTLSEVVNYCYQHGAAEVRSFALVEKQHTRKASANFTAEYVGVRTEDFYLFGYGMDYKGYLRNAAGIFAVSDADLVAFNS